MHLDMEPLLLISLQKKRCKPKGQRQNQSEPPPAETDCLPRSGSRAKTQLGDWNLSPTDAWLRKSSRFRKYTLAVSGEWYSALLFFFFFFCKWEHMEKNTIFIIPRRCFKWNFPNGHRLKVRMHMWGDRKANQSWSTVPCKRKAVSLCQRMRTRTRVNIAVFFHTVHNFKIYNVSIQIVLSILYTLQVMYSNFIMKY